MQEDALGNIYFVGREHMGVFQRTPIGEYKLQSNDFSKIRKYLNDDLMNVTILKNNEVLFGAKDGFIHYDPARSRNTSPCVPDVDPKRVRDKHRCRLSDLSMATIRKAIQW